MVYQVYRQTTAEGEFESLGIAGEKKFVDSTIPAGSSTITYKIRGIRPTAAGLWATFQVMLGVGSSGKLIAKVTPTPATKIAA